MINPIINAINAFLGIYQNLPISFRAFLDISFVILVVTIVISLFRSH